MPLESDIIVFEDRQLRATGASNFFEEDGACHVSMFAGPDAILAVAVRCPPVRDPGTPPTNPSAACAVTCGFGECDTEQQPALHPSQA